MSTERAQLLLPLAQRANIPLNSVETDEASNRLPNLFLIARSADVALDCLPIARAAASRLGGGGGGAPDFAQGGGPNVGLVDEALAAAVSKIREALG